MQVAITGFVVLIELHAEMSGSVCVCVRECSYKHGVSMLRVDKAQDHQSPTIFCSKATQKW